MKTKRFRRRIFLKETLFAIGEALIDFIPSEKGCSFSDVKSFSPKVGGAPANVLVHFQSSAEKQSLLQCSGKIRSEKNCARVKKASESDWIIWNLPIRQNTALAFVSLEKTGERTFSFYRNPSADMLLQRGKFRHRCFSRIAFALHFLLGFAGRFPDEGRAQKSN